MTELYELQLFLGYDAGKLVGKMFMIDRFKINQEKFNNFVRFWATLDNMTFDNATNLINVDYTMHLHVTKFL